MQRATSSAPNNLMGNEADEQVVTTTYPTPRPNNIIHFTNNNMNRVINNADKIANKLIKLGVDAVSDDGAVIVKNASPEQIEKIMEAILKVHTIGDGVQEGGLWINGEEII